ncbi:hypothetical protein A1A1_00853 [Planococcus antarcticus DSM 14505]|uniref:Uncharacterized protein n=1 Tax=Planococcus antarcticus DSM 14505 TaxID=1185653 RepID=A0AA87IPM4_9BACL|nr:putative immunity/bacteriocin fusion bifunctional protein [Planococcus antarcticus]EIM08421.1 hypothetical protein A1A1_00853 [Planococcus antarcticus DSM 14505]
MLETLQMKKKTILQILIVLTLFMLPISSYAQSPADIADSSQVLEGAEKQNYLKTLEKSKLFKETISPRGIAKDTSQVVHMVADRQNKDLEVDEFILVAGTVKNDPENSFYGIIEMETNEVKRIVQLDVNLELETIVIKDYNYDGKLVASTEGTLDELFSGDISPLSANSDSDFTTANVPSDEWWYAWACNFSSAVACLSGCVAFIWNPFAYTACSTICGIVFSSSVC